VLLRREGHEVNLKRVLRLYRAEGLKLRAKKRQRIASAQRVRPEETTAINQMWSMDFVSDTSCPILRVRYFVSDTSCPIL